MEDKACLKTSKETALIGNWLLPAVEGTPAAAAAVTAWSGGLSGLASSNRVRNRGYSASGNVESVRAPVDCA